MKHRTKNNLPNLRTSRTQARDLRTSGPWDVGTSGLRDNGISGFHEILKDFYLLEFDNCCVPSLLLASMINKKSRRYEEGPSFSLCDDLYQATNLRSDNLQHHLQHLQDIPGLKPGTSLLRELGTSGQRQFCTLTNSECFLCFRIR